MKLKVMLRRDGRPDTALLVTLDVNAKVADLAAFLAVARPRDAAADPGRSGALSAAAVAAGRAQEWPQSADGCTLRVVAPHPADLDPEARVGESGLRSGMTVSVIAASGAASAVPRTGSAVLLEAVSGPDRGTQFRLPRGTTVIGRDPSCGVRLTDTLVSRRHARITVGEQLEITDLGSANGLELGAGTVARALLRTGDTFRVGDTELRVLAVDQSGSAADESEGFNRPPRLSPVYQGVELPAPQPPEPAKAARIPIIPLFTPLLLGAVLYFTTHSATSLIFVGLSPLMALGYVAENGRAARRDYKNAAAAFQAAVADLADRARAGAEREVAGRRREHPSLAECVDAIRLGTALLWARRPGDPGFGELRLATATMPARNTIAPPDAHHAAPDLLAELDRAVAPFATVDAVPVAAVPGAHGAIGLAGRRPAVLGVARGLVVQAAALHSPAELLVTAFGSAQTAADWDWLKWLPHGTPGQGPLPGHRFAATAIDATTLVSKLEGMVTARAEGAGPLPLVLAVVEDDTPLERSRLVALAETGWRHGVYVLWIADRTAQLPAACRIFATVDLDGGVAGFADTGETVGPLAFEPLDAQTALDLALCLAPRIDTAARGEDSSDLPRSVPLLAVGGEPLVPSAQAVIERWTQSRSIVTGRYAPALAPGGARSKKPGSLRAVIGAGAGGPLALDLRADGPHALVGGTTGSGKSELLQAWILAMAAAHSPQRLTFLLVDYKGGSAFSDLKLLPHTVGLVTDLDQHLVRRSLVSLAAELHKRELHFATHHAKDLIELELRGGADAPPSLVIVVDEFAALAKELPEFVDGVINVAQRGRSLGVHLILATQRPAGVISDNLRANTNLRLALRMADEADSLDVLGSREAAYFDQDLPGRAVCKTGPGRLVPFQVGYAGGWTSAEPAAPEILVEDLRFGVGVPWQVDTGEHVADPGRTDLQRLVGAIREAREEAQLPLPRKPWLDALGPLYDFTDRTRFPYTGAPNTFVFGICDDPAHQAQPAVAFHPDTDGNLAVYGTGGSGKSTLLRTVAVAVGRSAANDLTHVYGLDFGSRGLAMLEELPHVGTIVYGTDHELISRLLSWLRDLVAERGERYARSKVNTITDYRRVADRLAEPRILLLVDGMAAFRQAYEEYERNGPFEQLSAIAAEGRAVGVHVLISADRAATVPSVLASSMQTRVVLRMADPNEYAMLGIPMDVLNQTSPPGRGMLRKSEIQVAVLGPSADIGVQGEYTRGLAASLAKAGVLRAPAVARAPELIRLGDLPSELDGKPVLGLRIEDLQPHAFIPSGSFIVSGAPSSGRTTTMRTLALALRRWNPQIGLHFFAGRRSDLAGLDLWDTSAGTVEEAAELARKLKADCVFEDADRPAAMFVEGFMDFVTTPAENPLVDLARSCVNAKALLVAETETSAVSTGSVNGLQGPVKAGRTGLALAPLPGDGYNLFHINFSSRIKPADFPPGRALFVTGGKTAAVQIASADEN